MTVETMPVALSQAIGDLRLAILEEIAKGEIKSIFVRKFKKATGEISFTVELQK